MSGANLRNANLRKANLIGCNINEAELNGADLTGVIINEQEEYEGILHIGVSHRWVTWAGNYSYS